MSGAAALPDPAMTVGGLIALAGGVWGLIKGFCWFDARPVAKIDGAVSPLSIKLAAMEIKLDGLERALADFKVEAARTYVTNDAVTRLEDRLDEGFATMRTELGDLREALMNALIDRRPPRPRS